MANPLNVSFPKQQVCAMISTSVNIMLDKLASITVLSLKIIMNYVGMHTY